MTNELCAHEETEKPPLSCRLAPEHIFRVPDHLRAQLAPAEWCMYEWTEYRAKFPNADRVHIGSRFLEADDFSTDDDVRIGHFSIKFENQLGLTSITPYRGNQIIGPPVYAEVLAKKFNDVDHSLRFLQNILDDLFARGSTLPFVLNAPTQRGVQDAFRAPNDLFAFHFFRHRGHEIVRGLQAIFGHPHRVLGDEQEHVRIHQVKHIERESLIRMLQGSGGRASTAPVHQQGTALERLRPERVWQRLPIETFDTPENRFIITASRRMFASIERIQKASWYRRENSPVNESGRASIRDVHRHLRQLVTDGRFAGLEASVRMPAQSRVLQQRDGYRDITLLWNAFHRHRQPVFQQMEHAIDLRDIATLYEYWLLFELIDTITTTTKITPTFPNAFDLLGHPTGTFVAKFHGVGTLSYQPSFSGSDVYSRVQLKPDYVWETTDGQRIVMDAKFRIQYPWPKDGEDPATVDEGRATTDDLTKMHAYRDAIRGVTAAIVLYPGSKPRFHALDGTEQDISLEKIVSGDIEGIGAIPMSPVGQSINREGAMHGQ